MIEFRLGNLHVSNHVEKFIQDKNMYNLYKALLFFK